MNAGTELDALVSKHVFGVEPCVCGPIGGYDPDTGICSRCGVSPSGHYSTNIAAAWKVWDRLHGLQQAKNWDTLALERDYDEYIVMCYDGSCTEDDHRAEKALAWADTAPLAICLAALRAVGYNVDDGIQEGQSALEQEGIG